MLHPQDIIRLYSTILFHDIRRHSVSDDDMKTAIGNMQRVYKPEPGSLSSTVRRLADYNSMAYRCAYLHKYAPFHTAMVHDIMKCILLQNDNVFFVFQKRFTKRQKFKICSLGGGPGSDTVGVLVTMFELFGLFPCSAKVIDIKSDWKDTLASVIRGLGSGICGPVGECFTPRFFNWDYLTADLLEEVQDDVKTAIGSADLVTMVKFVSAAACESTEWMLKKIFSMLKLGALVLFIDNSSGGFRQLVSKAATDCKLTSVCGPVNYQLYTNEAFNIIHWDHTSCYSTTVTVHMLQKLHPSPPSINITSKKIVDLAPKSNQLSHKGSNDIPIQNELPMPNSNGIHIKKELPSSNPNPLRKELSSNGVPIQKELSTSSDNSNLIGKELPTARSSIKLTTASSNDIIPKEIPTPSSCAKVIQKELPIANSHSIPIQNELPSICKYDDICNELLSGTDGTSCPMENINAIQNKNKIPICESTESECVPFTQRNGIYATELPILNETQNNDSCLNLPSKKDNEHPSSSNDIGILCENVSSKSKNRKRANQSDQSDFDKFTINEECLFIPSKNKRICATDVSKSRNSYNSRRAEYSSPNSASVHEESSEQVSVDLKAHASISSYVPCDRVLDEGSSELEENTKENESVEKLVSSVFDASAKSSLIDKTNTSSNDTNSKCCSQCTIL